MMSHLTAVRRVCCILFSIGVIAHEPAMGGKYSEVRSSCDRIMLGGGNDDAAVFARVRNILAFN